MEVETKLRRQIHEILTPLNERLSSAQKEIRTLDGQQKHNSNRMDNILQAIERDQVLRD